MGFFGMILGRIFEAVLIGITGAITTIVTIRVMRAFGEEG